MASWFDAVFGQLGDEMGKRRGASGSTGDEGLVSQYRDQLVRAGTDRGVFEAIKAEIAADTRLRALDVQLIAQNYNRGGKRPSSKTAALEALSKRFVEIVRFHAKNKVAEKARPW